MSDVKSLYRYEDNFPHLFTPLKVGKKTLKNRIVGAPTLTSIAVPPEWTPDVGNAVEYYGSRAKGGAAMVTIGEGRFGDRSTIAHPAHPNCSKYDYAQLWAEYNAYVHTFDCLSSIEFTWAGHFALENPKSASEFLLPHGYTSHALTEREMEKLADDFANGCYVAYKGDFDTVLLHYGHGWGIGGFLSPAFNKRTDKYGGSVENRCRFPIMVLERIREKVGRELLIELRISGDEYIPNDGIKIDECVEMCKLMEPYVDMIHISCGSRLHPASRGLMIPSHFVEPGHNAHLSKKVKDAINIPVGCVGAITTPEVAEQLLVDECCDYVVVARGMVADQDWAIKARTGKTEDIRPCIHCQRCTDSFRDNLSLDAVKEDTSLRGKYQYRCTVNPTFSNNWRKKDVYLTNEKRKVVVVGGGVAGCEAAINAAKRGHEVVLYEQSDSLGGILNYAKHVWFKQDMYQLRNYYATQVAKANILVKLNTKATPELIYSEKADELIVAIGAKPVIPPIKGFDGKNVVNVIDVYGHEKELLGKKVAIVGGGNSGCETALHLSHLGYQSVVVEMGEHLAKDSFYSERMLTLQKMEDDPNIETYTFARCVEVTDKGIKIETNGEEKFIEADNVINACGYVVDEASNAQFAGLAYNNIKYIGDCKAVGTVYEAVQTGYNSVVTII